MSHYTNTSNPIDFPKPEMNARVRQLMLEAGYAAPELAGRARKLVDLIIQDSINEILKWRKEPFPFDESTAVWILKEHFGVEE